jgi:enolase-phosphatase E1
MKVKVRGILLDIEGTTSALDYVHRTLFPFARQEVEGFLQRHWAREDVAAACEQIARDAGAESLAKWVPRARVPGRRRAVVTEVYRLMDVDAKVTGLKALQGLIWQEGYAEGRLQSHVFPDVPPALEKWAGQALDVRIYSSGSVTAQKVFFAHTEAGDLTRFLRGHYDTTTGPKREADSYRTIAREFTLPPADILFLSDVVAELDAARTAGMRTGLLLRPGNARVEPGHTHPELTDFTALEIP